MRDNLVLILGLALAIWLGLCVRVLVGPAVDDVEPTDVTYVLASPGGVAAVADPPPPVVDASALLVSVTPETPRSPAYDALCLESGRTLCVIPDPSKTQGEARNLGRLAKLHGWESVTVVTHRSHIARTRMLMERCYDGEIRMYAVDVEGPSDWPRAFVYETGAWIKALVLRGC